MPRNKPTAFVPYILPVRQIISPEIEYPWQYSQRRHSNSRAPLAAPTPFRAVCSHAEIEGFNGYWKHNQSRFAENGIGLNGYEDPASPVLTSSSDSRTRIFYPTSCHSNVDQQLRVVSNTTGHGMGCHDTATFQRDAWQSRYQCPNHGFQDVMFRRTDSSRHLHDERVGRKCSSVARVATTFSSTATNDTTATTTTVTVTTSSGANVIVSTAFTTVSSAVIASNAIPETSTSTRNVDLAKAVSSDSAFKVLETVAKQNGSSSKKPNRRQKAARNRPKLSYLNNQPDQRLDDELHLPEPIDFTSTILGSEDEDIKDVKGEEDRLSNLEHSSLVKRNNPYEGTLKQLTQRIKKKKEERSKEEVACKIFGLLCLQGSRERRYEISVEELRRRVSAPEHLNKVDMISYLRLAKNSARQLLEKHDIISSLHHRLSKHTVLSKVSERECEELANGVHDINMSFFPFEVTAKTSVSNAKKSGTDSTKRKQNLIKRLKDLEVTR
eukprot:gene4724-21023_t